jgi:hypothetical protein
LISLVDRPELHFPATFDVVDDLLGAATRGELSPKGKIVLLKSGQVSPLVELLVAASAFPSEYRDVRAESALYDALFRAKLLSEVSGAKANDRAGAFPLARYDPAADDPIWEQWVNHAENAAVRAGISRGLTSRLMGALGELQERTCSSIVAPQSLGLWFMESGRTLSSSSFQMQA